MLIYIKRNKKMATSLKYTLLWKTWLTFFMFGNLFNPVKAIKTTILEWVKFPWDMACVVAFT